MHMKKILTFLVLLATALMAAAQNPNVMNELQADPMKAYGNDYPYKFVPGNNTKAPKGYKAFYISHYARHGSRYYWNSTLYKNLDTLLTAAKEKNLLTDEGKAFADKFFDAKDELMTGISELTQLGWEQHQGIARRMYDNFTEVFEKGGDVLAISSLSGRCVISMSAFCQELVQCNPKLEIREQSSRFILNAVVPTDGENPSRVKYAKTTPRYESSSIKFPRDTAMTRRVLNRVFTSTEGLPSNIRGIAGSLKSLYTSLPNIYHEGMMGNIFTDQEIMEHWEADNLGSYSWVFNSQNDMIPILRDILGKAEDAIKGRSSHVADLRFGHDSCIGPLTVLMGLNGANLDPENPYDVKYCYQNWETSKACNIQLIFYRNKRNPEDILVKCLLNESEATLPVKTDMFPFYRWDDVLAYYTARIQSVQPIE